LAKIEFMANPAPKNCTWKIMDENESRNNSRSCNISTIIEGRYYVNLSWTVKYTSILLEVNNKLGTSEFTPDFNDGNIIGVLPTSQDVSSESFICKWEDVQRSQNHHLEDLRTKHEVEELRLKNEQNEVLIRMMKAEIERLRKEVRESKMEKELEHNYNKPKC